MLWLPLVVDAVEDEIEVAVEVVEEQKEVVMMSLVLSGCHHVSGGNWRQQGLKGHPQLVKALGHHQFCDGAVKEKHQVMKEVGCKEVKEVNKGGEEEMGKPPGFQYLLGGEANPRSFSINQSSGLLLV